MVGQELALLLAVAGVDRDRQPELDAAAPSTDRRTGRRRAAGHGRAQYPGTYAPAKPWSAIQSSSASIASMSTALRGSPTIKIRSRASPKVSAAHRWYARTPAATTSGDTSGTAG